MTIIGGTKKKKVPGKVFFFIVGLVE